MLLHRDWANERESNEEPAGGSRRMGLPLSRDATQPGVKYRASGGNHSRRMKSGTIGYLTARSTW